MYVQSYISVIFLNFIEVGICCPTILCYNNTWVRFMKIAGIIAEYNPFHNGHLYHLNETKKNLQCDYCIVVMAGSFMQRGEAAIRDKFFRTQIALQAGADLVLELPTVFSTGNAELFAYGGIKTLAATGVCTHLSFGTEIADLDTLTQASIYFDQENVDLKKALRLQLQAGKSFPRARYDAAATLAIPEAVLKTIATPNSILALEYLKAIRHYAPTIKPFTVERQGYYHSLTLNDPYPSGTAIRTALLGNEQKQVFSSMPSYAATDMQGWKKAAFTQENISRLMLYALRCMTQAELQQIADVQEGFENVLFRAARRCLTLQDFLSEIKSKRYTLARCRRIACHTLLHITKQIQAEAKQEDALYLRVLGFKNTARSLLSAIGRSSHVPLLLRHADTKHLTPTAKKLLELDMLATDIYLQAAEQRDIPHDFSQPPIIL